MKARPPGAAIDVTGLASMAQGLGDPNMATTDPYEIYAAYDQTGIFAYSSMRPDGSYISNSNPIQQLDGGVSQSVGTLLTLRSAALQEIYNVTGFNPTSDGSNQSKDALVGVEKIRANAFNINMMPYTDSINYIMDATASKVAESIKDRVEADSEYAESLAIKIGKENVDAIELSKGASMAQLAVYMRYLPTAEEMIDFKEDLLKSEQAKIIDPADAMNAKEIAKTSIKGAISYLKKAIKHKADKDAEIARANSEQQSQIQMQSAQAAEKAKAANIQMEWSMKTKYMVLEKQLEGALTKDEYVEKRISAILDAELKEALIEEANLPDPADNKVSDKLGGGGLSSNTEAIRGSVSKHPRPAAGGKSEAPGKSAGLGIPKPAMGPRIKSHPGKVAQQNVSPTG